MFCLKHVFSLIICNTLLSGAMSDNTTGAISDNITGAMTDNITGAMADNITFVTVAKGSYSAIEEPINITFQTSSEFDDFWALHTSNSSPPDGVPAINFTVEMVLCVFRGTKMTGGYGVEIKAVEDRGDEVVVSCETRDPPPGAMVTMARTQPFHIVRATKSSKNVTFEYFAAELPPPPFPTFVLTFKKESDHAAIVEKIESLNAVINVMYLNNAKIAFVAFNSTQIDKYDAAASLQSIDGVVAVEAVPPM